MFGGVGHREMKRLVRGGALSAVGVQLMVELVGFGARRANRTQ
jgi:hypothetical protein